jgi:septal ring factor EnvC (AmiA/AmiB activator)
LDKQAEHNKKVKSLKKSMKKTDVEDRKKAEKSAEAKPEKRKRMKADRPKNTIKKEAMDFTDFLNQTDPLYEVKGEMPKCPPGYKWNPKTMRCEPKTIRMK